MTKKGRKLNTVYHFVPNGSQIYASSIFQQSDFKADSLSGSLKVNIKTKGESIFAHYQDTVSNQRSALDKTTLASLNKYFPNEKKVLFPLFYSDKNIQKQLILGSSIKGLLRSNVANLTCFPMQRVQERSFAFRPNISQPSIAHREYTLYKTFAARVKNLSISDNNESNATLTLEVFSNLNTLKDIEYLTEDEYDENYTNGVYRYQGCTDYYGYLAQLHDHTHENKTKQYEFARLTKNEGYLKSKSITVSKAVIEQYLKTTDHLCDQVNGHLSPKNPILKDSQLQFLAYKNNSGDEKNKPVDMNEIARSIQLSRSLLEWRSEMEDGDLLIFVEAKVDCQQQPIEIVSFGNNYRYYWMYRDTVTKTNGKLRKELLNNDDIETTKKSTVVKLFGHIDEDNNYKIAGKVNINHALEVIEGKSVAERNQWSSIPYLGSPKSSAFEHYLSQPSDTKRLMSYGEQTGDELSLLAGRKKYFHSKTKYGNSEKQYRDPNSSIAAYVTPRNTKFNFTLRFRDVSKLELGILVIALNPNILVSEFQALPKKNPHLSSLFSQFSFPFAQKLGYARPHGFGSVEFTIAEVQTTPKLNNLASECVREYITFISERLLSDNQLSDMGKEYLDVLSNWLSLNELVTDQETSYPSKHDKNSNKENPILAFHSHIRSEHNKQRKCNDKLPVETKLTTLINIGYQGDRDD